MRPIVLAQNRYGAEVVRCAARLSLSISTKLQQWRLGGQERSRRISVYLMLGKATARVDGTALSRGLSVCAQGSDGPQTKRQEIFASCWVKLSHSGMAPVASLHLKPAGKLAGPDKIFQMFQQVVLLQTRTKLCEFAIATQSQQAYICLQNAGAAAMTLCYLFTCRSSTHTRRDESRESSVFPSGEL